MLVILLFFIESTNEISQGYEKIFEGHVQKPKSMQIFEAQLIKYYASGQMDFNHSAM